MASSRLAFHWPRIQHSFGKKLSVGQRRLRVRGYLTNEFASEVQHEPHLLEPLRRAMTAKTGAIIDVGMNAGQTLLKVLAIDPKRQYVGFDPQIDCCFFVERFLRDNGLDNHQVLCLALSDRDAMAPFYSSSHVGVYGSLVRSSPEHHRDVRFVASRIGDEVLRDLQVGDVAIIKVDVEGAEPAVFAGLKDTIAKYRPICFFEALAGLNTSEQLATFFRTAGYEIRRIASDGSEHPLDAISDSACDYVAYPRFCA